jgi:hypothetical protein
MMFAESIIGGNIIVAKVKASNGYLEWRCPGCEEDHIIPTANIIGTASIMNTSGSGAGWFWNGDVNKPTVAPSVLRCSHPRHEQPDSPRCHVFIREGKLMFMVDSTHHLAGHTVEIPEWQE